MVVCADGKASFRINFNSINPRDRTAERITPITRTTTNVYLFIERRLRRCPHPWVEIWKISVGADRGLMRRKRDDPGGRKIWRFLRLGKMADRTASYIQLDFVFCVCIITGFEFDCMIVTFLIKYDVKILKKFQLGKK